MADGELGVAQHAQLIGHVEELGRHAVRVQPDKVEPKRLHAAKLAVIEALVGRRGRGRGVCLKTKNGRKNVKSARYRPILSANRTRPRPTHVYARANPAQIGGNGGN